jgi:sulfite reductase (ferredoxin)
LHKAKSISTNLKPLADTTNLVDADFIDWGNADNYVKAVEENAGVVIDLVATLLLEAKDKLTLHKKRLKIKNWADAIAYAGFVNGAKALLLSENEKTNHQGNHNLFDTVFIETNKITIDIKGLSIPNQ